MRIKIVTDVDWPSFRNVALDVQKALKPCFDSTILDWKEAETGGNILFIETVRKDTLKLLRKFLPKSNIVFYGTTEGHSFLDEESINIARKIKVVAVSNFVKQMLEEVNISVAGVVHHGLDMDASEVDLPFLRSAKERFRERLVALTIASNDPRKGLDRLLKACRVVEGGFLDSFQVLHSQPKRYYDLPELVSKLGLKRVWLTNRYGLMASKEVNALYKLCHIYVLSSLSEGFGLPMLEAFRFNKPVIAVDAPPFNEVIEDGRTGKLIPYKEVQWFNHRNKVLFKMYIYEPQELGEAILSLLSNSDLRENMENQIRERKHCWSIHNLYPRLLDYF